MKISRAEPSDLLNHSPKFVPPLIKQKKCQFAACKLSVCLSGSGLWCVAEKFSSEKENREDNGCSCQIKQNHDINKANGQ
jgi:hypothetical protein